MGQLKDEFPMDSAQGFDQSHESKFPSNYNIADKSYVLERSNSEDSINTKELNHDARENAMEDIKKFGSTGASEEYTAAIEDEMLKKPKLATDSGRKIADMNIEGMPWFHEPIDEEELQARRDVPELNGRETRRLIYSSLLAAFMVAGVFILALFLFLLFCTKIWF